jgi:hypothetical protein
VPTHHPHTATKQLTHLSGILDEPPDEAVDPDPDGPQAVVAPSESLDGEVVQRGGGPDARQDGRDGQSKAGPAEEQHARALAVEGALGAGAEQGQEVGEGHLHKEGGQMRSKSCRGIGERAENRPPVQQAPAPCLPLTNLEAPCKSDERTFPALHAGSATVIKHGKIRKYDPPRIRNHMVLKSDHWIKPC